MLVNDRKMNIIEQERKIRIILYMNTIEFSLHPKYTADLKDFKRYPLVTRYRLKNTAFQPNSQI